MPDSQRYPLRYNVVFPLRKVLNSDNFFIVSYKQEVRKSLLQKKTTKENKQFLKNMNSDLIRISSKVGPS